MDFSKITQQDKEEELRVKTLLELSTKKYNMQKELENLKMRLSVRERELEKLRKKVILLQLEVPVLEKQEGIMKKVAESSLRQFVVEKGKVEKIQELVWDKINNFVSEANAQLEKNAPNSVAENPKKDRRAKLELLKLEGEVEALQLYRKYQTAKIKELRLIKTSLEDDSFAI